MQDARNLDEAPDAAVPRSVSELLSEYRQRQDELRQRTEEVARLFEQVLAAADQQSARIIAAAQADIRRAIIVARREMLALAAQVEEAREAERRSFQPNMTADAAVDQLKERMIGKADDLREAIAEAHTGLDSLPSLLPVTAARTPSAPAETAEPLAIAATPGSRGAAPLEVNDAAEMRPGLSETETLASPGHTRRLASTVVALFSAIGVGVVVLTMWWSATARTAGLQADGRASASVTERLPEAADERHAVPPQRATATAGILTAERSGDEGAELIDRAQRWLDAYYRYDGRGMAQLSAPDFTVSDDRREDERLPPALVARRSFEGVAVQLAGAGAVVSGKMLERSADSGSGQQVSWFSQTWARQDGQWLLTDVRLRAASRLK